MFDPRRLEAGSIDAPQQKYAEANNAPIKSCDVRKWMMGLALRVLQSFSLKCDS